MNEPSQDQQLTVADAIPALARLAATAWWRTTVWGFGASVRAGRRVGQAMVDPNAAVQLVEELSSGIRTYAREFLGITDLDERVRALMPPPTTMSRRGRRNGEVLDRETLRVHGAELLRQAADVAADDDTHPAYARILTELAPDEARILRLLMAEGPQPTVDVRATNLIGVGSQLIAPRMNMIGAQAGARHRDRVQAYLNNLDRLGLIFFSGESLEDPIVYQVLEAQPDVLHAIKDTTRAKTVRRSVKLTAFGRDFCEVCLPLDTAEIEALTAGE